MRFIRKPCNKCSGYVTGHKTSRHKLAFAAGVVDRLKSGELQWPSQPLSFKAQLLKLHAPLIRRIARTTARAKKQRQLLRDQNMDVQFDDGRLVIPDNISSANKKRFCIYNRLLSNIHKMRSKVNDAMPLEIKYVYTNFPEGCSSAAVAIERRYLEDPRCVVIEDGKLNVTKTYTAYHDVKHPTASAPWRDPRVAPISPSAPECSCLAGK